MTIEANKTYSPYFTAYIAAHGLKPGDYVKLSDYSSWIVGKHKAFRRDVLHGERYNGYSPEEEAEFLDTDITLLTDSAV